MSEIGVDPAISLYFAVQIDGHYLGAFIGCEGLTVEIETEVWREGGNNDFAWTLPKGKKYSNIKLTRPLGPESQNVADWIAGITGPYARTQATITAMTPMNEKLVSWTLQEVIPVRWEGPSFNAESAKVAQETLELAHNGFVYEDPGAWK